MLVSVKQSFSCFSAVMLIQPYVTVTLPGLSGALSASVDLPEVPAAGSELLLPVVPGVISVLRVPTSLTQNYNTHTHVAFIHA